MAVVGDYRMTLYPFLRDKPELPTSPTAAAGARRRGAPEVKNGWILRRFGWDQVGNSGLSHKKG